MINDRAPHTHRLSGQSFTHAHGTDEVRRDLTLETHGYFGHVEDQAGERFGAIEGEGASVATARSYAR